MSLAKSRYPLPWWEQEQHEHHLPHDSAGIILLGLAIWALVWAVRSGQFDDLESQGWNVVLDDDSKPPDSGDESDAEAAGKDE